MKDLTKKYNFPEIEKKWQDYWVDNKIFKFDWNDTKRENIYAVDTPPPTVSGQLHMGHIFSYTQAEFITRFQRMRGKNVFYPIGYDDNGLPTERYIEKLKGIKGKEMERDKFVKICQENVHVAEKEFEKLFKSAGFSFDWNELYQTISEDSRRISQMSFIDLYNKGVLYQKEEPVIWDVIDQTALAQTEVEEKEFDGAENYLRFEVDGKNSKESQRFIKSNHSPLEGESAKPSETKAESEGGQRESLEIMTTRPELLPACVAVMYHPDDDKKYKGKFAITPLGVKVPMIADDKVDKEKGTGVVMCCTFGDQTDVDWFKKYERKYGLKLRIIITKKGKINTITSKDLSDKESLMWVLYGKPSSKLSYDEEVPKEFEEVFEKIRGLKIKDARTEIIEFLKKNKKLTKESIPIKHSVKVGERSKYPIEFLVDKQWFIRVLDIKKELHEKASQCDWRPKWMERRIHDWVDGLAWDWCISRQRFSGVAIPVWYSKKEGEEGKVLIPNIDQLPVDPTVDLPIGYKRDEVRPDTDIMDTWATSAVSPQLSSQGITDKLVVDKKRYEALPLPFDLRPQAHEIIRTWAFCTIVKAHYHENKIPWKNVMISGWCLAADNTKMSKSKGNIVDPTKLIAEKSADAVRYWASNSNLGNDVAYSEDAIKIGQKLVTKLFNASKFASFHFKNLEKFDNDKTESQRFTKSNHSPLEGSEKVNSSHNKIKGLDSAKRDIASGKIFEQIDLWLISKLHKTIEKTTEAFENYEYAKARESVEDFFWNDFCDNYLEIAKVRCYGANGFKYKDIDLSEEEKWKITQAQQSAIRTIYYTLKAVLKLFSPFIPHVTEEIFSCIYEDEFKKYKSIHSRGMWPKMTDFVLNEQVELAGKVAIKVLSEVRKYKSDNNLSMKNELEKITIYIEDEKILNGILEDLKDVCNAKEVVFVKDSNFKVEI